MLANCQIRPLGEVLQQAGLLSSAQLEVVLQDQKWQPDLRIGDILEIRGWVKRDAIEFFAEQWPQVVRGGRNHPLGYYWQQAGLLDSGQVKALLQEQAQAGLRIGALAVLHGWLSQKTLDWFLQALAPEDSHASAFIKRKQVKRAEGDRAIAVGQARANQRTAEADCHRQETVASQPASGKPNLNLEDIPWAD